MFSIGDRQWPGISKLLEESGEVGQVCGKLMGSRGQVNHWDGSNLRERLQEELADLQAAISFVIEHCGLDAQLIEVRSAHKRELFKQWHRSAPREN